MAPTFRPTLLPRLLTIGFCLGWLFPCLPAGAAMPELVGVVELLTQDETAQSLELTDDQISKLKNLADQREMDGLDAAIDASRLPAEEQNAKLAPFRLESEKQGLAILSDSQQAKLSELLADNDNPLYDTVDKILARPAQPAEAPEPTAEEPKPAAEASEPAAEATEAATDEPAPSSEDTTSEADATEPAPMTPGATATDEPAAEQPAQPEPLGDGKLTFSFRFQPWPDVLDWFADQADLSLVLDAPPSGTFNYRDSRRYTVGEAMDVLNNVLQTKGFTLLRKGRMLLLVNLEDEIPPNLITDVMVEQLDQHGEHELIRVLFHVRSMPSQDLAEELKDLVGPQGRIIVLSKANMIQVTETTGRIRTIREVIESLDGPAGGDISELALEHVMVEDVLPIIRQMLGIASDSYATPSGSLQLAVDPLGGKIFARGDAKEIARVEEVIQLVDVVDGASTEVLETPQLEVYSTGGADSELVLKVLQTLMAEAPGIRLAADAATGNLVALARPSDHATIRATLAQMQQDARQVEVIPLDTVDPTLAKLAVDRLFNAGDAENPDPRAPIVEADLNSYSLIVRATPTQITDIKNLLDQLGENGEGFYADGARGNIRVVPLTGSAAQNALSQVQQIWPAMRSNKIRIVTPSASGGIPEYRPSSGEEDATQPDPESFIPELDLLQRALEQTERQAPRQPPVDPSASRKPLSPFRFAAQQEPAEKVVEFKSTSGATIIVASGPGGLLIASEDLEALDEFEDLLREAAGTSAGVGRQFAVFYLKYADAATASEILANIFNATGGGGDLMGDIAGGMLNDMGGGMMGDLLGLGMGGESSGFSSAAVDIVPDMRLNALIVYANPQDLDMVEQLLKIVDQRTGPAAVEAGGKPRLIPVHNSSAEAVAEVVRQVYQDRIQGGSGGQPSPQDLMKMLQRGGGGGGGASIDQEPSKMTLGVDARSNSVIVRAPDPLFEEVKLLVEQLDEEGLETPQATRVISLQHSNAEAVKEALESLLGPDAVTASTAAQAANSNRGNRREGGNNRNAAADAQRRMEMFRQLQRASQQGRGGRGGGGAGGRGGRGGGGGGRGR